MTPMTLREEITRESKRRYGIIVGILAAALICLFFVSLCMGKYNLSLGETIKILWEKIFLNINPEKVLDGDVIFKIRLPRIVAAIVIGAALSVSGAVYQGIFQNPLVSPDFLGVSSGSCIGAAIAILMALPSVFIQGFAFIGGIIAVSMTLIIPRVFKSDSNILLVL